MDMRLEQKLQRQSDWAVLVIVSGFFLRCSQNKM